MGKLGETYLTLEMEPQVILVHALAVSLLVLWYYYLTDE